MTWVQLVPQKQVIKTFQKFQTQTEILAQKEQARIQAEQEQARIQAENECMLQVASERTSQQTRCNVSRQVQLVPPFNENEVDKYFQRFEKVAQSMKWPKDKQALMVQSVLRGKAQEAYSTLSLQDSLDYDKVKAVLKAYKLVPGGILSEAQELP